MPKGINESKNERVRIKEEKLERIKGNQEIPNSESDKLHVISSIYQAIYPETYERNVRWFEFEEVKRAFHDMNLEKLKVTYKSK